MVRSCVIRPFRLSCILHCEFLFCLWCVFTAAMSIARDDSKRANEVKKAIQRAPSLPSTSNPGQSAQSVHGCHIVLMCLYLPVNACPRLARSPRATCPHAPGKKATTVGSLGPSPTPAEREPTLGGAGASADTLPADRECAVFRTGGGALETYAAVHIC